LNGSIDRGWGESQLLDMTQGFEIANRILADVHGMLLSAWGNNDNNNHLNLIYINYYSSNIKTYTLFFLE